jgi:PhnB protein
MPVNAVPEGYRTATPYLTIKNAPAAIDFYKRAFGAEEMVRMAGPEGKVMHAEIRIGDSMIMMSEEFPGMGVSKSPETLGGTTGSVHLYVADVDKTFSEAVDAGAKAVSSPMDMFGGDRFAQLIDPYGHVWSIATHKEDLTPEEMDNRIREFTASMQRK